MDPTQNIAALRWPPSHPSRPGVWDRVLMFVPILGWVLAADRERRRRAPTFAYIAEQLRNRPEMHDYAWAREPRKNALAERMASAITDSCGWPNAGFVAEDPMAILCWDIDPCDLGLADAITEHLGLGRELADQEISRLFALTFGEALDYLLALEASRGR